VEINFLEVYVNQPKTFSKLLFYRKKYFKTVKEQRAIFIHTHFVWAVV